MPWIIHKTLAPVHPRDTKPGDFWSVGDSIYATVSVHGDEVMWGKPRGVNTLAPQITSGCGFVSGHPRVTPVLLRWED